MVQSNNDHLFETMSKSSLIPLDFFIDICPFDLYSKTGPSIPSCGSSMAPDLSIIHGMNISTANNTTCLELQSQHPMFNGELLLSYCPSTSLNIPCPIETSKSSPALIPCALTISSSNNGQQTILNLWKTINDHLDDINRLLIHMDTSSDRRMHEVNILLENLQNLVQRAISIQNVLLKPLNESSSDMLKLNMFIRSNNFSSNQQSFYLDHRLHENFVVVLKQLVLLVESSRLSNLSNTIDLQHQLDSIHEQTTLMHEHLVTITRKLESNII